LPFNPSQAGREFLAMFFMVGNTGTTDAVTGTAFFRARTIYGVMWAGHGISVFLCTLKNGISVYF
jgi:hypothetical protein